MNLATNHYFHYSTILNRDPQCQPSILPARDFNGLTDRDVQFLVENFPKPGRSYEEIASLIHDLPATLESRLHSESLFDRICDPSERILQISPFLFFSVLLRRSLTDCRILGDRRVINYISNLLSIFVQTNRLYRIDRHDQQTVNYLTDMIAEAENADSRRQFLIYSHIGNYSLYVTGLFSGINRIQAAIQKPSVGGAILHRFRTRIL